MSCPSLLPNRYQASCYITGFDADTWRPRNHICGTISALTSVFFNYHHITWGPTLPEISLPACVLQGGAPLSALRRDPATQPPHVKMGAAVHPRRRSCCPSTSARERPASQSQS
eukprot:2754952-Prymnesium_polylepis.1